MNNIFCVLANTPIEAAVAISERNGIWKGWGRLTEDMCLLYISHIFKNCNCHVCKCGGGHLRVVYYINNNGKLTEKELSIFAYEDNGLFVVQEVDEQLSYSNKKEFKKLREWRRISSLFDSVSTATMGCRSSLDRQSYINMALSVGAIDTGEDWPSGRMMNFSKANTPDWCNIITGYNVISSRGYKYYGVGWNLPNDKYIYLQSGSDPRHQYDGRTRRLW